ncbi:nitroreductase [Sediminicola sp. YIK13]|uniref:nitroreductase family protein n=1 Tax=Sediminicola sp. YIK13 TaxID=1453352 RepID=UPI0007200E3D|nr:nitroreductase family protein [Sediminicola sp. YIK13]ALM06917.1 nitroreductase [Sediminicola sp. YIK13]
MTEEEQVRLENIADTEHEIFALLKQRWSPRTFREEHISDINLKKIFEAARWAASSNNEQPWRFIYANKGTEAYDKIFNCLSEFNKQWASNAPTLLLTAFKEKDQNNNENFHALQDLGLCLGNMTVQAQYLGIALHQMAGLDWKKAQTEFNVPNGFHVSSAVALGYYGGDMDSLPPHLQEEETKERSRMPQENFAFHEKWVS